MRRLLINCNIVTVDAQRRVYPNGAILVDKENITRIGSMKEVCEGLECCDQNLEMVDLRGKWVLPGLINTHVHTSQQLGRGIGDDVDLITWLHERIWPYESHLTEEDSYVSTLLCGLELIRSGVTCFAEAGGHHVGSMAKAVDELGIRAVLSRSSMDCGEGLPQKWKETTDEVLNAQISNFEKYHNSSDGRIRCWFSIRTIFNATDELLNRTKKLADDRGVGVHMHVAELKEEIDFCAKMHQGRHTAEHLKHIGFLDRNLLAAHSVWLNDNELESFSQHNVKVSHCPAAAMRYLGFARIPEMLERNICVSIGTDGAPSNNRMTLIDDMWMASSIHKGHNLKPTIVPSEKVLEMATINGACAVLWENQIGSLEVGKKADLILIDSDSPNMLPMNDPISNIVTAMQNKNVVGMIVNGKWIMRDGKILTVNEQQTFEKAKLHAAQVLQRANVKLPKRFNWSSE